MSPQRDIPRRRVSPFFSGERPRILAHRGLALEADENTLDAFTAALAAGAQILETDVRATRDGAAVLFHDERLTSGVRVGDLTLAELRETALPHGGQIASLREALEVFPLAKFNLDIKAADAVAPVVMALLAAGATDRVLIASFSGARQRATSRDLPGVARSASSMAVLVAVLGGKLRWVGAMRRALRDVDAVQIPETVLGLRTSTPSMISRFHAAGVEVHVWTVNDESDMVRLRAAGVDGIVTDRTDVAQRVFAL